MASFGTQALGNAVFGTSTKAQLIFIREKPEKSEAWNVMINPSSIYESYGIGYRQKGGVGKKPPQTEEVPDSGSHTMSMDLIFDLVDTYELAYNKLSTTGAISGIMSCFTGKMGGDKAKEQHDGKLPRQFAGYSWGNKVSDIYVDNPKLTCLTKLKEAVSGKIMKDGKEEKVVTMIQFMWGKLSITGFANDLSVRYTYFSPEGYALRAEVSLRITEVHEEQAEDVQDKASGSPKDNTSSPDSTALEEEEDTSTYD